MSVQQPRGTGAINVKFGVEVEMAINAIAARHGLPRTDWLRKLVEEALDADAEGRPLFQRVEGPRIDASLHDLVTQLRAVLTDWDRVSREHDRRERKFAELWSGGEEAARAALERLNREIIGANRESYQPFVEKLRVLRKEMADVSVASAKAVDLRLEPLATKITAIHTLARQPRVVRNVVLGRGWVLHRKGVAVFASLGIFAGVLLTLIIPTLFDKLAVGQASRLITRTERMCLLIERQYGASDCNVPASVRRYARDEDQ